MSCNIARGCEAVGEETYSLYLPSAVEGPVTYQNKPYAHDCPGWHTPVYAPDLLLWVGSFIAQNKK